MSDQILKILQHALGVDEHGQGEQYRCHFVAGPGHSDFTTCRMAEARGLMTHREIKHLVGGHCFYVTEAGRRFVAENSPPPPVKTRGQIKYERYLNIGDALGCSTFRDFLRWESAYAKAQRDGIPF